MNGAGERREGRASPSAGNGYAFATAARRPFSRWPGYSKATRNRYQVVVTSSQACAKGSGPGRQALHLCDCYTPMR